MFLERIALFAVLGVLIGYLDVQVWSATWWCFMGLFIAYGWASYTAGYNDATELAEASWKHAKKTLEEAIARETRVQELIKDYKEDSKDTL